MSQNPRAGYGFSLEVGGRTIGSFRTIDASTSDRTHKIAENLSVLPGKEGFRQPAFRMTTRPTGAPRGSGDATRRKIPGRLKWADVTHKISPTRTPLGTRQLKFRGDPRMAHAARDLGASRVKAEARSALDRVALKWQPTTLRLKGFVPSGASVASPDLTQSGQIVLRNDAGASVARWSFTNAWPSKLTGPSPRSDGEVEVTLVVDGLKRG